MSDYDDLIENLEIKFPAGRELTDQERESIKDWTESQKEYFILTKRYGDPSLIPQDLLQNIQAKALAESRTSTVVDPPEEETLEIDYDKLWRIYPKRADIYEMKGYEEGMELARQKIKTIQQYKEALIIIKKYAARTERRYVKKFNIFMRTIEEEGFGIREKYDLDSKKQKLRHQWALPRRPFYPWEVQSGDSEDEKNRKLEMSMTLSKEQKAKIAKEIAEKDGFYDKNNPKWWYEEK